MKRLFIVLALVLCLSFTAFAEGRLGVSFDFNSGWGGAGSGLGLSAHFQYNFLSVIEDSLKVGAGASFWLPILDYDYSQLAIYASGMFYFLKPFNVNDGVYFKLNLGFNFPLFVDGADPDGGFYNGWGIGYDFSDRVYAEIIRGNYKYSVDVGGWGGGWNWTQSIWHFTIGFKF